MLSYVQRAGGTPFAIAAFSLSLLGTFLVRSGVITSVHAFAADPSRGVFILIFLGIVIGSSLLLYAWRAPQLADDASEKSYFAASSRETLLLANNLVLVVAASMILLGTLYPLVLDALSLGELVDQIGGVHFTSGDDVQNAKFQETFAHLDLCVGNIHDAVIYCREISLSEIHRLKNDTNFFQATLYCQIPCKRLGFYSLIFR